MHGILLVQGLKNNWAKFLILWVSASTDLVDFPNVISHQLAGLLQLGKLTLIFHCKLHVSGNYMMQRLQTWRFRKTGPMQLISFICTKLWPVVSFSHDCESRTPSPWNLMWFGRSQHQAHYPASLFLQFLEFSISSLKFQAGDSWNFEFLEWKYES